MAKKPAKKEQEVDTETLASVETEEPDGSIAFMAGEEEGEANAPNEADAALIEASKEWSEPQVRPSVEPSSDDPLDGKTADTAPLPGVALADHIAPERGPTGEVCLVDCPAPAGSLVEELAYNRFRVCVNEGNFPEWEKLNDEERAGLVRAANEARQAIEGMSDYQQHVLGVLCWK